MLDTLRAVESAVSERCGPFELFGLFRRRRATDWDVVAAAPWVGPNTRPTLELLVAEIKRVGGTPALLMISGVIVNPDPPFADAVRATVEVEHGLEIVGRGDYGNVEIARGYVITSRRPAAVAVASA